ncbi:MAG TPA: hypothetical protein VK763_20350 [Terriglobales bacterium]|nr:hypothetical protein [Terriglobales bacterium]
MSAYVSTAIAAGVGLLAMTAPSEAEVVYTPAHTNIPVNNNGFVPLDLNHDGVVDFAFWNLRSTYKSSGGDRSTHTVRLNLYAGCAPSGVSCRYRGNEIWGTAVGGARRLAFPLPTGFSVGANKRHFQQFPEGQGYVLNPVALMGKVNLYYEYDGSFTGSSNSGSWRSAKDRYVGLQFAIGGQVHYGWARLTVDISGRNGIVATLTGYAYETIPGKPIMTNGPTLKPATLGHLAQGAAGISAWRKRK